MAALLVILAVLAVIAVAVWFYFPGSRNYIAGAGAAVALFLAALLTGFANWIGGLG